MESTSSDSKMICWLCQERKGLIIKTRYKKSTISLCPKCKEEYTEQLESFKEQSVTWVQAHIDSWLTKTRSVKRVYNRQRDLFESKP